MKPLALRARNLRSWAELELEVPAGIVAVVGANGAGKSSLVNVIDLALFGGVDPRTGAVQVGRELKRARTRGAGDEPVEVELVFEHAGEVYRVRRGFSPKGRGKPSLDFEHAIEVDVTAFGDPDPPELMTSWEPLGRETIDETQAELERVIGLTRRTFRASSYLAQDDGAAFTMAEPRDRKAILLDALGVQTWDRLHELAGGRRRHAEASLSRLVAEVETREGELEHRDAKAAAHAAAIMRRDPIAARIEDRESGLRSLRIELEDAQALASEQAARREKADAALRLRRAGEEEVERRRAALNGQGDVDVEYLRLLAATEPNAKRLVELKGERQAIVAEQRRLDELGEHAEREEEALSSRTDELVSELAHVREELEALEHGRAVCPTCRQPLGEAATEEVRETLRGRLRALEREQGETLDRARAVSERLGGVRTEGLSTLERAQELGREWSELFEKLPKAYGGDPTLALAAAQGAARDLALHEEREKMRATATAELDAAQARLAELRREEEEAASALGELKGPDVGAIKRHLEACERAVADDRSALRLAEEDVTRAAAELERLARVAEELEVHRREREAVTSEVELLKTAERAYGRDGVPALILEARALPHLEAEANRIIGELGRDYRFELRTLRETGAGTIREALDVVVYTATGEALYEDFSGGERTRLDLALRIALARLVAARRGSDVRLLAIDEPAYLDEEGFAQLATVLRRLAGEFETILVVSHVDTLRDAFDSAIIVGGGADTSEPSRLEEVT